MATNNKWERWQHYQKYGVYPETTKQQNSRKAKERDVAENGPTEQVHEAGSAAQFKSENPMDKFVREWWEAHPHLK
jgi:hypothetical protein